MLTIGTLQEVSLEDEFPVKHMARPENIGGAVMFISSANEIIQT